MTPEASESSLSLFYKNRSHSEDDTMAVFIQTPNLAVSLWVNPR